MILKINCEFNYLGTWCKCKQIKRKWYEIGGRGCMEYSDRPIINLLNENNIKFDLLNSITYTKRIGGISGYHSLLKKQHYKNWYSELPNELDDDRLFGNFEFPYHEWLYIDGKHYDFVNFNGVDSVFDMKWMIDYFYYVKNKH